MAILSTEFDSRIDALVTAFEAVAHSTLATGLPSPVSVYKGPYRNEPTASNFSVFVSRNGTPEVTYDLGDQTAQVYMGVDIAAATYSLADSATMDGYVSVFAANVAAVLFGQVRKTGAGGWYAGLWRGSDAISLRDEQQQTVELEVFRFEVRFQVNYA